MLKQLIFSQHALYELKQRGISKEVVEDVIYNPQQILPTRQERVVHQSIITDTISGRPIIIRVIIKETINEFVVITVYKTSQIGKYWRE